MNKVIVIGTDHYNTLWLIRSLGMARFEVIVVIINSEVTKSFVTKSKYCTKSYSVNSITEALRILDKFSTNQKIPIFTNSDSIAEALDEIYDSLSSKYILQNCNQEQGYIKYWMNKTNMLSLAKECGMTTPYSLAINLNHEILDYKKIPYPCLIKPEKSSEASKTSFRICYNENDLKKIVLELEKICSRILIQEYIKTDYEYLVYGASTKEEVILPGGLRKVHTCSDTKNLGMASYAYISDEVPYQLGNFECIKHFIRTIGYCGLFSIEFMITKDKAYFLEINLRNDGTCYFTLQAGVNVPALWASTILNIDTSNYQKTLIRSRTYGINEANYFKYTLKTQSLLSSFKELRKVKAFSLYKWNDMLPIFAKIFYKIQNIVFNNFSSKN